MNLQLILICLCRIVKNTFEKVVYTSIFKIYYSYNNYGMYNSCTIIFEF